MTASVGLLREGVGTPALWLTVLLGFPAALVVQHRASAKARTVLHVVATVGGIAVLVHVLSTVASESESGAAALQVPLAQAFIWLLLCQAFDTSNRRGLLVLLVASPVILGTAGVLSIDMALALWIALWAMSLLVAIVVAYRDEVASLPRLGAASPKRGREISRAVGTSLAVGFAVVLIGAAVFMVAPVAGTSRALTFPASLGPRDPVALPGELSNPTLGSGDPANDSGDGSSTGSRASFGYFGFSKTLDTSLRGRPDNTIVMRVRASSGDFWQAQTFDRWDGRVWSVSDDQPAPLRGDTSITIPGVDADGVRLPDVPTDELVQTYYLDRDGPNMIFGAATPVRLYFPEHIVFQVPDGSVRAGVNLYNGAVYTVVSRRALTTPAILRAADDRLEIPANITEQYADAPVTTPRVRALAARITANAPTTYDKVRAIETWMSRHTKYTINIPPLPKGADAVDQFLFVDHRGFCEQIGTSLVVMLRSLGIPARLAVGYAQGERNPFTGLYEVRASDAHAWAQVYFPGIGWQSFDPTASVPLAGDSAINGAGSGAWAYLTAHVSIPGWAAPAAGALALAGLIVVLAVVVHRRRRRRGAVVVPSWAAERLGELETWGTARGRARAPSESTRRYTAALASLDEHRSARIQIAGRVLDAAMFSPHEIPPGARAEVEHLLAELAGAGEASATGARV
jgi:transglutaminase-like putative cysteine protease